MTSEQTPPDSYEQSAISDVDWLMRVRVRASESLKDRFEGDGNASNESINDALEVLSGLLEDLQSGFDIAPDAYRMFALTYRLRRDENANTDAFEDPEDTEAIVDAIGEAIAAEQGISSEDARLYRLGFVHGLSAAVKNIHMNS